VHLTRYTIYNYLNQLNWYPSNGSIQLHSKMFFLFPTLANT